MKILEQRFLRGPNIWTRRFCLQTIIDLEDLDNIASADIPGFNAALLALVPTLEEHRCSLGRHGGFVERLWQGTYMAHIIEHLTLELQCLAGAAAGFGRARKVRDKPRQYRIVVSYQQEQVAMSALQIAIATVGALAAGQPSMLLADLEQLKALAAQYAIGTSTAAVLAAARKRGIPCLRLSDEANLFQLGWGSRQKRLQATITGDTSNIAVGIASNKQLTKNLLQQIGLPVPRGVVVTSVEQALAAVEQLRYPVTLKPLDANQGKGVTTRCQNAEDVRRGFAHAHRYARRVIVERHIAGQDYRVLVTGGKIAAAALRKPPGVRGDGIRTVRQLVELENSRPERGNGHSNILTHITLDEPCAALLREQGYQPDSVPAAGAEVTLRGNANLSTGGTAMDVTDQLHPETRQFCIRAARQIGLDIAGIDIICRDIKQQLHEQRGAIIEVNAAPGIRMHEYPSEGQPRDTGTAIIDAMFGIDDGRIPLIAVTGTNGKTTTSLLIAHTTRMAGLNTGVTTTEGIYINHEQVNKGDCSGYWSARSLLTSPEVDIAVLETARGGILKRGLAFDRCDVSVVLNVSADHLGMDGIDTLDDLARVKAV